MTRSLAVLALSGLVAACALPRADRSSAPKDAARFDDAEDREAAALRRALLATIERFGDEGSAGPSRSPPTVRRIEARVAAGLAIERLEYDVRDRAVPVLTYAPIDRREGSPERRPVVVVLHGTRKSKEEMIPHLERFAGRGYLAVSIDARHHGRDVGPRAYEEAMLDAFRGARHQPYLYDTVRDVLRLLDVLEARADVDPRRIALVGISKGGTEAYLAAAIDLRVAAVAPLIGVQSFRYALDHDLWRPRVATFQWAVDEAARSEGQGTVDAAFVRRFFDRIAPGLVDRFDGPDVLPLIAPRPLFVANGDLDPRTPLAGVEAAIATASAAYARLGRADLLETSIQRDTGHVIRPEVFGDVADWLDRVLFASSRAE